MEPVDGLIDHVTPVVEVPVTCAVNCWVAPEANETVAGVRLTATVGFNVMTAEADADVFAVLVAVTVTVVAEAMEAGAV